MPSEESVGDASQSSGGMDRCWSEHGCPKTPLFAWHDGLYTGGKHCAWHAPKRLPSEDELPAYGTSAGLVPIGTSELLKTKEEFRAFLQNDDWEIQEQDNGPARFVKSESDR